MEGISGFFKRIQGKFAQEFLSRNVISEILAQKLKIQIKIENIRVKNGIVTLSNLNQSERSAIFIKKQQLISEINSKQSAKKIVDIR